MMCACERIMASGHLSPWNQLLADCYPPLPAPSVPRERVLIDTVIQPPTVDIRLPAKMIGPALSCQVLAYEGVTAIFVTSAGDPCPTTTPCFSTTEWHAWGSRRFRSSSRRMSQGPGFMAAGYPRDSGRVGLCLVTSAPVQRTLLQPVRDCMRIHTDCRDLRALANPCPSAPTRFRMRRYRPS